MSTDIIIQQPDAESIKSEWASVVSLAHTRLPIENVYEHRGTLENVKRIREGKKAIKERMAPVKEAAHKAHKQTTALEKELLEPLNIAEKIECAKLDAYELEQGVIAEAEQQAAEVKAMELEEHRRKVAAHYARELDGEAAAVAILNEPIEAPVIHIEPEIAKVEGISSTTIYKAEVFDLCLLAEHVGANPEWEYLIEASMKPLNTMASAQREAMKVPGVRVVKSTSRSVRTG